MKKLGEKGFSMVEMAVVVAIIGILVMTAVPSFIKMLPRIRLSNQASQLANEIASQRMQAIAKSTDFRVVFNVSTDRYTLGKWNGTDFTDYATNTLSGTDLVSVSGLDPDPPGNVLVLYGHGGASVPLGTKAAVLLQTPDGDIQKRVLVEPTGRAIVEKRLTGGGWVAE